MTVHVLKCDEGYFEDVRQGAKEFEVRADDRDPPFTGGDVVALVHTDPGPSYGAVLIRRIGYLARGERIPPGFCVFALRPMEAGDTVRGEMAMGKTAVSK